MSTPRGTPVTLDKERRLRFSLRTVKEMQKEFGEKALETGLEQNSIARVLWYGLRSEDPDITEDAIEDMVDLENLAEVMKAVAIATGQRSTLVLAPDVPDVLAAAGARADAGIVDPPPPPESEEAAIAIVPEEAEEAGSSSAPAAQSAPEEQSEQTAMS